ncbi:MAG: TonB family protein [Myxococcales bacterium]|nr:TonB family protein [Myxococcales bacterium]
MSVGGQHGGDGGGGDGGISRQISAQVFGVARPTRRRYVLVAALLALGLHLLVAGWARFGGPSLSSWGADLAVRMHAFLRHRERAQTRIDLARKKPAPPPKPKAPTPPPKPAPSKQTAPSKAHARAPVRRAAPARARAGRVVSAKPDPNAPVDFANAFVSGDADRYAGGVTAPEGKSKQAVRGEPQPAATKPARSAAPRQRQPTLRRRVSLDDARWSCPWPAEADAERIDATSVVMRVRVAADGRVERVKVVKDPGFGFGAAAKRCALRAHFRPALGPDGKAVRSWSPPIRVRFSR